MPPAPVTEMRQLGAVCGNLDQGAARPCNGASQPSYEHPWCPQAHTFAVLFLPGLVGNFFDNHGVAHGHDLMDLLAMQTLAMGGQLAFLFRLASPGLLIALFLDATFLIIVVGIGRSSLALHFAVQATKLLCIRFEFLTKLREGSLPFTRKQGDGRRPQVAPDDVLPNGVVGFGVGNAFKGELHEVAIALSVGALCLGAAGTATDQASVLDAAIQAVCDHRIVSVDERFELILLPEQIAPGACFCRLDHKTESRIVAFILDAGQASSPAAKAHSLRSS